MGSRRSTSSHVTLSPESTGSRSRSRGQVATDSGERADSPPGSAKARPRPMIVWHGGHTIVGVWALISDPGLGQWLAAPATPFSYRSRAALGGVRVCRRCIRMPRWTGLSRRHEAIDAAVERASPIPAPGYRRVGILVLWRGRTQARRFKAAVVGAGIAVGARW